ncbi:hypothetical protein Tco_1158458 [Tanacetum coccineum]
MDEEFTTTAYPNVHENLKLPTEDQVVLEEPASSIRTLSSLQNIDKELSFNNQFLVEMSQEEEPDKTNTESEVHVSTSLHNGSSTIPTSMATVTTITITTSLPPPPPQLQQCTTDLILVRRIVRKAVDEIVNDAVDWAMQAPLRARFSDLPARDYSNQLLADLDEARKKKRKRRESPRTLPGSPHSQPPPPPPPAGASSAPGNKAPSSSKTAASSHQSMAWTTSDTRYESTGFTAIQETSPSDDLMHDDSIPDKHVHLSYDEDSENDHLPKDNVRKDWWKPLPEEERPATPEPAWTIPSSNVSDVKNNRAFALVSTYETLDENSLLAKTGDMATFINWYCRKVNKIVLTQADFEGRIMKLLKPSTQMSFNFSSRWKSVTRCSQIRLTG